MFPIIDRKATGINIRKIMDNKGISVKDVQQYLNLASVQSVYHWLNGISIPTIDNLYALSELFQVTIDEMICGNRRKYMDPCKNTKDKRLYTYFVELNNRNVA